MLKQCVDYRKTFNEFRWEVPYHYNIAFDVCDRHAGNRSNLALIYDDEDMISGDAMRDD